MKRELMDGLTVPAWLLLFVLGGALLGLLAWALDWLYAYLRAL